MTVTTGVLLLGAVSLLRAAWISWRIHRGLRRLIKKDD